MNKSIRPVIYLLLGAAIYFIIDADDNPQVLDEFHQYAPIAILILFVLILVVRQIRKKKEGDQED
ncbi:MAG: hypothetical protein CMB80_23560 [Flammeovirgaceae bacterium]|nr:hypothetical protein [Flammeovirgaceae bacterium]MBE63744.1 hypothetical protein [Flammeovirgaceae bacterium]|tara:strand:- start:2893 stop:3087 length:195 start_codon:yes stop_codon:yes gene_type:complete